MNLSQRDCLRIFFDICITKKVLHINKAASFDAAKTSDKAVDSGYFYAKILLINYLTRSAVGQTFTSAEQRSRNIGGFGVIERVLKRAVLPRTV